MCLRMCRSKKSIIIPVLFFLTVSSLAQNQTRSPLNTDSLKIEKAEIVHPISTSPEESINLSNVSLVIAAMGAQIGSIVAVFIAFAIQELKRIPSGQQPSYFYRNLRDKSRLNMLLNTAWFAMLALLSSSIFTVFGIATLLIPLTFVVEISFSLFTYGILCMLLSLLAYLILERPFFKVNSE